MPGPWDHETDRKLLLCLVDPNIKPKWAEIAAEMGQGFTNESVRINKMPFAWTPEDERVLLLVAISQGNVQPGATLWNAMIQALGDGVTDRAVSASERTILLLAMGKTVSFDKTGSFCAEVAAFLGSGVTPNAVSQRFYKLKKESEALTSGTAAATTTTTPTNTPKKQRATPGTGGGRKRKDAAAKATENGNDAVEDNESPTKKPRAAGAKKKTAANARSDEESDVVVEKEEDDKSKDTVKAEGHEDGDAGTEAE